jgi:hypothetical protein
VVCGFAVAFSDASTFTRDCFFSRDTRYKVFSRE